MLFNVLIIVININALYKDVGRNIFCVRHINLHTHPHTHTYDMLDKYISEYIYHVTPIYMNISQWYYKGAM